MPESPGSPSAFARKVGEFVYVMPINARQATLAVAVAGGGIVTERGILRNLRGQLTTAGSSSTTARVLLNGTALTGTLTLAASATGAIFGYTNQPVEAGDRIEIDVTAAGTGAAGLTLTADIVRRFD